MSKWLKTTKFSFWFMGQTQRKGWLTSKTFWNSLGQKIPFVLVALLGLDLDMSTQIGAVLAGAGAIASDLWVRKHTTKSFGDAMQSIPDDRSGGSSKNVEEPKDFDSGKGYNPLDDPNL